MTYKFLKIRKIDEHLNIENMLGKFIAQIDDFEVRFLETITGEELETINMIKQNFSLFHSNLTENE